MRQSQFLDPSRPIPSGLTWYVMTVDTKPFRQCQIAEWLEGTFADCFTLTPLETRWRIDKMASRGMRRGGARPKRVSFQVPLLPRYVLVGFKGVPHWLHVLNHYGITGVIGDKGTPLPMRKNEPERLQMASEKLRRQSIPNPVRAGGKATITAPGLFCGHVVEVRAIQGKKARIIQQMFGAEMEVAIDVESLEAA